MRGRRHTANNRTTSKLKRKVAAASGIVSSGIRSSGQMAHNMDKCHNLSVPCSSAVRDVICDIFPELNAKSSSKQCKQSLLGQIIRKYLLEEKDKRLRVANDPVQRKKKRKKKKKKATESVANQSFRKNPQSSTIINNNEKQQHNFPVIHKHKLDIFIENLLSLNKHDSNENNVQIKAPPESRDLSALLEFIRYRYQEFNKSNRPIPKGRPILTVSEIPTIPLQKLQELCERIQCQSCRDGTLDALKVSICQSSGLSLDVEWGNSSLENIEDKEFLNTFILNASCVAIPDSATKSSLTVPATNPNHDGDGNAHDDACAFDYIGMEEGYELGYPAKRETAMNGNAGLHDGGPQLNFVLARYEDSSERFVQLRPLGGPDQTHSFPFSTLDIDGIIRHIIIPCGLVELEQQDEEKISPESIAIMKKEANTMIESFDDKLNDLAEQIKAINKDLKDLLHEASENYARFAPLISKKLRECDSKCEIYMESFMEFLISLHLDTSAARLEQKWLNNIEQKLWDVYEEAIQSLIEPSLNHRWNVINLQEDCTKNLPPMYNSPEQRAYTQLMIEEKLEILTTLNNKLQVLMSTSSDEDCAGDSTTLKHIVAYTVYFSHKYIEKKCFDTLGSVCDYKSLYSSRSASVCKTIHETKVLDILKIQSKRTKIMRDLTKVIVQNMEDHSEAIIVKLPLKFESEWKANNIAIEDRTISVDDIFTKGGESEASLASEKKELRESCYLVGEVAKQCRLLEDLKNVDLLRSDNSTIEKLINPGYSKNLDGGKIIVTIFANEERYDQIPEKCDGGGGKRRVMSIISACIYDWLQDRCMEWHADVTQKELLSAVDDDSLGINGAISRAKKVSKKKKDRRKTDVKISSCVIVEASTDPSGKDNIDSKEYTLGHVGSNENDHDESLLVVCEISDNINERTNKKISDFFEEEKLRPSNMIDSKKRNITSKEMVAQRCSDSHYLESILGPDRISLLQTTNLEAEGETRLSVGVVYGTKYISAKEYLINRYLQLNLTDEINYIQL